MAQDTQDWIDESTPNRFVSERALARHWGVSRRTLQRWRAAADGPPFSIIGGSVRYRMRDILAFENRLRGGRAANQ
ncbi:helix-turn-helix domain-containing protein [Fluviibacterium sp. DFM31]|uniref:Helix-turn-helix domain-containing protein n=1 Tax=Meridianimarinicoccus marinus TaxID=3231483 RepID=A0ABV3L4Z1_9RHOB